MDSSRCFRSFAVAVQSVFEALEFGAVASCILLLAVVGAFAVGFVVVPLVVVALVAAVAAAAVADSVFGAASGAPGSVPVEKDPFVPAWQAFPRLELCCFG